MSGGSSEAISARRPTLAVKLTKGGGVAGRVLAKLPQRLQPQHTRGVARAQVLPLVRAGGGFHHRNGDLLRDHGRIEQLVLGVAEDELEGVAAGGEV